MVECMVAEVEVGQMAREEVLVEEEEIMVAEAVEEEEIQTVLQEPMEHTLKLILVRGLMYSTMVIDTLEVMEELVAA